MAKATMKLANGATVTIEGTPDEVATLLAKIEGQGSELPPRQKPSPNRSGKSRGSASSGRKGQTALIVELAEEGYFKSKRTLADILAKLAERGHIYAIEGISPILPRLVRRRILRRIKEKGEWVYVA